MFIREENSKMKKICKNDYGVSSPLEFSIASMALIATIVIVTASMAPPIEHQSAQLQADVSAKASEIMNILLTPESDLGLVIETGTSVPVPVSESIIEITVENIRPEILYAYPNENVIDDPGTYLYITIEDDDEDLMDVNFLGFDLNGGNPIKIFSEERLGLGDGPYQTNGQMSLQPNKQYRWEVTVSDGTDTTHGQWVFSTKENKAPTKPLAPEEINCAEGVCPIKYYVDTEYTFRTTCTDEGKVYYYWEWGDGDYTDWDGPYDTTPYPVYAQASHIWTEPGIYGIRVKAKDVFNQESGWSAITLIEISTSDTSGGEKCFIGGTQILMADGSLKNIEDIQIGEMVKSYDEAAKSIVYDRITEVFHDTPDQMVNDYYLSVNDKLGVTPEHPLYINSEWIQAKDLAIGDQLYQGEVVSIEKIYERVPTYNLETEKYHNYLVKFGNDIVIAHNVVNNYFSGGYDETISLSRLTSVTPEDYTALLSMDKIYELSEMSYSDLKEMLTIPSYYEFYIVIRNKDTVFLSYMPDRSIEKMQASIIQPTSENVIIVDSVGYAYATITVTVIR